MVIEAYVYVYRDINKPGDYKYGRLSFGYEPFYVGKGTRDRWRVNSHLYGDGSSYLERKLRKLGDCVNISFVNHSFGNKQALEAEKNLICGIGRKNFNNGPLLNMTDGGEGLCGYQVSEETRKKLSKASMGRTPWIKGKKHTKEAIEKIREAGMGRSLSDEAKKKISNFHKGKKWRLGGKNTAEHNNKIREANTGNKPTEETKEKMRQAKLKNPTRYWLGKEGPTKGKKFSEEKRVEIREKKRKTWAKNKEKK